ncbi:MAG TPA: FtsX-like permease family protein [Candidatus Limnocylindria bacterium]|nr:FtsX-like permease family protein [Candidatus Limnocylindria bacterium]
MVGRMLLASMRARQSRLALALLAVSLGVAVATALATLTLEVGDDLARTLRARGPNFVVQPRGASLPLDLGGADLQPARAGLALDEQVVAALKRSFWKHNVLEASPELALAVTLDGRPSALTGVWFERELAGPDGPWRTGLARLHPTFRLAGRWPGEGTDEIALGRDLAARLGLRVGAPVTVAHGGQRQRHRVTAIVSAGGLDDRRAWAPLRVVQDLAGRTGEVDRVWFSALVLPAPRTPAPDPEQDPVAYERYSCTAYPDNVARDLALAVGGADVLPLREVVAGEARIVGRLDFLMIALSLLALGASILGVASTATAAVVERRSEIALLHSLGAARAQLAALLLGETSSVALLGGVAGWVLGSLAAFLIRGHRFDLQSTFHWPLLPIALLLALGVGVLGTLVPLRQALRIDPATVLRGSA